MTEIQPGLWVANRSTSIFAPPELASRLVNGLREQVATLTRERDEYRAGCQEWNEKYESWRLVAGEAREAALQAEVDVLHNCGIIEIAVRNKSGSVSDYMTHWEGRALKAEALLQKQDDLAPLDVIWREKFESYVRRAEAAEAAIVSLQADYKGFELELFDIGEALDGQFPSQEPCVARAVQQQREALDRVQDELRTLQAQLQAITQEIREESERIAGGERPPVDSFELKVWADALDAAAKGQQ